MSSETNKPITKLEGDPLGKFTEEGFSEVSESIESSFELMTPCISFFIGQICADIDLRALKATVWLKIGGFEVARISLDVGQSHILRGEVGDVAKAEATITFETNGIKVDGRGCRKTFIGGWRCSSFNFWLIQW